MVPIGVNPHVHRAVVSPKLPWQLGGGVHINGNNVATVSGTNSETVDAAARIEAGLALSASSTSGSTSPGGSGSASDGVGDGVGVGVGGVVVGFVDGMEVDGKIDDDDGEDPSSNASAPKRGKGVLRFR